jgi:hypothetical protein
MHVGVDKRPCAACGRHAPLAAAACSSSLLAAAWARICDGEEIKEVGGRGIGSETGKGNKGEDWPVAADSPLICRCLMEGAIRRCAGSIRHTLRQVAGVRVRLRGLGGGGGGMKAVADWAVSRWIIRWALRPKYLIFLYFVKSVLWYVSLAYLYRGTYIMVWLEPSSLTHCLHMNGCLYAISITLCLLCCNHCDLLCSWDQRGFTFIVGELSWSNRRKEERVEWKAGRPK